MKHVLLVDDVVIIRNLLVNIFKTEEALKDYQVSTASSAEEAMDLIYDNDFSVIVLDWMLPGISGLEMARNLHSKGIYTPILMLTSISERNKVAEALKEGVQGYLIKPIVKKEFMSRFLKLTQPKDK